VLLTVAVNCSVPPEAIAALVGEIVIATGGGLLTGLIVTVALACLLVSATLVTVTVAWMVDVTVGAVNSPELRPVSPPELEIVPTLALHVTAVSVVLATVAVKACVPPEATVVLVGEIAIETGRAVPAGLMVTLAVATFVESAVLVAVMVACSVEVTVGAVNNPDAEIVPTFAVQVTVVLLALFTVAANCCTPPESIVAVTGSIVMLTAIEALLEFPLMENPAQDAVKVASKRRATVAHNFSERELAVCLTRDLPPVFRA